jgi:hypothetical protein
MRRLHAGILVKSHHYSTFRSGVLIGLSLPAFVIGVYQSTPVNIHLRADLITVVIRLPADDARCYSWMGWLAVRVRRAADTGPVLVTDRDQPAGVVPLTHQLRFYFWYELTSRIDDA